MAPNERFVQSEKCFINRGDVFAVVPSTQHAPPSHRHTFRSHDAHAVCELLHEVHLDAAAHVGVARLPRGEHDCAEGVEECLAGGRQLLQDGGGEGGCEGDRGRRGEGKKLAAVGGQGEHGVLQALLDGDVSGRTAANESVLDVDESPDVLGFAVAAEAQIN
jgi:hypothetical protein